MRTHTKETQATTTPQMALEFLREGNYRFVNNLKGNRDLLQQVNETRDGQFPFAAILSCIDSQNVRRTDFRSGFGRNFQHSDCRKCDQRRYFGKYGICLQDRGFKINRRSRTYEMRRDSRGVRQCADGKSFDAFKQNSAVGLLRTHDSGK